MELNQHQEEETNMFDRRNTNYELEHLLFDGDAETLAKKGEIDVIRLLLNKAVGKKLADTSGESGQKKVLRDKATKTIGNKARSCAAYFEGAADFSTEKVLLRSKTYYNKKKQGEIVLTLTGVVKILNDNIGVLGTYGVNAVWVGGATGQIATYDGYKPLPAAAETAKSAADDDIDKYIGVLDKKYMQLENNIVNAFEDSNPDETGAFIATGFMDSIGVRHNIVDADVKDSVTLVGINRVLIILTDTATGLEIKRMFTDAHGLAEFICVNKDVYADISAEGYVSKRVLFKPNYRDTYHLDVVLVHV